MALEREMAVYREHLPALADQEGKFVVVKGEEILPDVYGDYEAALGAGYDRFGPVPFLVKQVRRIEPVLYFTRDL